MHELSRWGARADMGPRATGKEAVATVVVDKMRRRMRQNGYHAHITLQVMHQSMVTACMLVCSLQDMHSREHLVSQ